MRPGEKRGKRWGKRRGLPLALLLPLLACPVTGQAQLPTEAPDRAGTSPATGTETGTETGAATRASPQARATAADPTATPAPATDGRPAATTPDLPALRDPAAFAGITDPASRSVALFQEMGRVLQSPRCLNCHPVSGGPTQGDAMAPHSPPVLRGPADQGGPALGCASCHGAANYSYAGNTGAIPGATGWQLAPLSMGWQGRSLAEICAQLKDPEQNGGRDLEALYAHDAHDALVGWAWDPGPGRIPAPGTQALFGALTRAWIDTGAVCPPG